MRVVLVYLAAAFATLEAADVLFPALGLPEWTLRLVIGIAGLGLPLAIVLAWAFELTPDGLARTPDGHGGAATTQESFGWFSPKTLVLVVAMLVLGLGAGWMARSAATAADGDLGDPSIAVIPLENLSLEADNAFLAVGIQDEILTQLQKISQLHVISRSSVMRYQPGPDRLPVRAMAGELGARWIVEGSVARVGQKVRFNVQLIDAMSDDHLWAEAYDGDLTVQGMLSFQAQIARRVAESLRATIQPHEESRIDAIPTQSTDAYTLYLRGVDLFSRRREEELFRALAAFDEAIALDADYALAHAGRALVYAVLPFYSDVPVRETKTEGLASAYRALALDSTVAEAHAALGDLLFHGEYDMDGAETSLRRAIELKPSYAQAYDWLSEVLLVQGKRDEELAASQRALELDPLSLRANVAYGMHLTGMGRADEAVAQLQRAVALDSTFAQPRATMATAHLLAGRYQQAAAAFRRYASLVGPEAGVLELAALGAGDPGLRADALRALDAVEADSWKVSIRLIAQSYVLLGEHEKAIDWLERADETGNVDLPFVFQSAEFEALRENDRFRRLAARLNLSVP